MRRYLCSFFYAAMVLAIVTGNPHRLLSNPLQDMTHECWKVTIKYNLQVSNIGKYKVNATGAFEGTLILDEAGKYVLNFESELELPQFTKEFSTGTYKIEGNSLKLTIEKTYGMGYILLAKAFEKDYLLDFAENGGPACSADTTNAKITFKKINDKYEAVAIAPLKHSCKTTMQVTVNGNTFDKAKLSTSFTITPEKKGAIKCPISGRINIDSLFESPGAVVTRKGSIRFSLRTKVPDPGNSCEYLGEGSGTWTIQGATGSVTCTSAIGATGYIVSPFAGTCKAGDLIFKLLDIITCVGFDGIPYTAVDEYEITFKNADETIIYHKPLECEGTCSGYDNFTLNLD